MKKWTRVWGVAGLERAVDISFSTRLKHALGRCTPATGRIVLTDSLRTGTTARLADALCHELAHVAAFMLHGGPVQAHGAEWAHLVDAAGMKPRSHRVLRRDVVSDKAPSRRRGLVYEHRCPVCQTMRLARRRVTRWRCAECVAAGLSGEMIIARKVPGQAGQ
jgi:predicted SprT family Zn-dependent metalloprotease